MAIRTIAKYHVSVDGFNLAQNAADQAILAVSVHAGDAMDFAAPYRQVHIKK